MVLAQPRSHTSSFTQTVLNAKLLIASRYLLLSCVKNKEVKYQPYKRINKYWPIAPKAYDTASLSKMLINTDNQETSISARSVLTNGDMLLKTSFSDCGQPTSH